MVVVADLRAPLGVLGSSKGRPGGAPEAPEFALGALGEIPGNRSPHLKVPRMGLGPHFGDPKVSTYEPNTHIYIFFMIFNEVFFRGTFRVRWGYSLGRVFGASCGSMGPSRRAHSLFVGPQGCPLERLKVAP